MRTPAAAPPQPNALPAAIGPTAPLMAPRPAAWPGDVSGRPSEMLGVTLMVVTPRAPNSARACSTGIRTVVAGRGADAHPKKTIGKRTTVIRGGARRYEARRASQIISCTRVQPRAQALTALEPGWVRH